jgi:pantothenate kinase type III
MDINGSAIDSIEQECKIILKATVAQVSLGCHCRMVALVEDAVKSTDSLFMFNNQMDS